jgi:hypothetical protein
MIFIAYSIFPTNGNPAQKIMSNLSAKRSTLKSSISKTSPMTPDFLYNSLTLLQSRN